MGADVVGPREALAHYRNIRRDSRVTFVAEPPGLDEIWSELMESSAAGRLWTDAYLTAFAMGHGYSLASFDRGFRRWKQLDFAPLGRWTM